MKNLGVKSKWGVLALNAAVLALGITALVHEDAYAARPRPDCGPTREWNCVVPGCPSCTVILFEGTVCEKTAFERQTGRVCSPA